MRGWFWADPFGAPDSNKFKDKQRLGFVFKPSFVHSVLAFLVPIFVFYFSLFSSPIAQASFSSLVEIGLAGDFYIVNEIDNNAQGFASLTLDNSWDSEQLRFELGSGGLVGDTATSYLIAPQIFYRTGNEGQLTIGRALHDWSYLDNSWNMGLTQPLWTWAAARPEAQGLTGLFVDIPFFNRELAFTFV